MSDTMEQYPAAAGVNTAATGVNTAAAGVNTAAAGVNTAASGVNTAAAGVNRADAGINPAAAEYPVTCSTPFMNCVFGLDGWTRVVFMICMAISFLVGVAYMIMKLVQEGEGKNKLE